MARIQTCLLLFSFFPLLTFDRVFAQVDVTWNGGNGQWNNGANWSGGMIPFGVENNALIDGSNSVNSTVRVDGGQVIDIGSVTVSAGDSLVIDEQAGIAIPIDVSGINPNSGTIVNHGRVEIGPTTGGRIRTDTDTTLSGGGTIALMKSDSSISLVGSPTVTASFTNIDNAIEGVGTIKGTGNFRFINQADGVIDANVANGILNLHGDRVAVDYVNHGVMRATNGGKLVLGNIESSGHQGVAGVGNAGGTIVAGEGSTVFLGTAGISGGTLKSEGTGRIETGGSAYVYGGVNLAGQIKNVETLNLTNPLTNHAGEVTVSGPVTLSGGGIVNLSGGTIGGVSTWQSVLTNEDNMIRARGAQIGNGDLTFINGPEGLVRTYGSPENNPFVIDATFVNEGKFEVYYRDYAHLIGPFTNTASGTITGEGNIIADETIINEGRIAPGPLEEGLFIHGSLLFTETAALEIDVNHRGRDFLIVFEGDVSLDGALEINVPSGFIPDAFTELDILVVSPALTGQGSATLSGTFAGIANGDRVSVQDGTGSFVVRYDYDVGRVWLSNYAVVPEPSSTMLAGIAVVGCGAIRRRTMRHLPPTT